MRQALEQAPGDLAVPLDERPELPRRQTPALQVGRRDHGRRSNAFVDQRDLAEVVAGAERAPLLAADGDVRLARLDDEEADAAGALLGDRLALRERAVLEAAGDRLELMAIQSGEERDALEELDRRGHAADLTRFVVVCRAASQFLDPALRAVEPLPAEAVELLAALPERERLVEVDVAALEPLDDLLELLLRLLECRFGHSTRAPKLPSATSTPIASPDETASAERTIALPERTIA